MIPTPPQRVHRPPSDDHLENKLKSFWQPALSCSARHATISATLTSRWKSNWVWPLRAKRKPEKSPRHAIASGSIWTDRSPAEVLELDDGTDLDLNDFRHWVCFQQPLGTKMTLYLHIEQKLPTLAVFSHRPVNSRSWLQIIALESCAVCATGTLSEIESNYPQILRKWNAIIAREHQSREAQLR